MSQKLRTLQAKKAAAVTAMRDLSASVEAAGRDYSDEESAKHAALKADADRHQAAIDRETDIIAEEARMGVSQAFGASVTENIENDGKRGFRSLGDFASSVRSSQAGGRHDHRLDIGAAAPSTFGGEATGADGGFLIPPEFASDIYNLSLLEDSLLPMVDNVTTSSNSMVFPKDETTPWGTDGVRAYWQAEATSATATKPKLGTSMMRLHKLMALVPLTEELLSDTNSMDTYLPNLIGRAIRWKTNEAILNGDGNGQPLGMFKGGAAVTVTKDSGQAANTISLTNITNMIARLPPGSFPRAQWFITPDALPSLFGLTLGNYPIYLPTSAGAQGSPYGTLMGRPINVSQHAAAFSAAGDIQLFDGQFYRALTKGNVIETATSMHLYFDAATTAFRAMFRVDGQPKISAAISQAKGSNTLSPFLQLGAR